MTRIAMMLEENGYTLNSGGADGADKAFAKNINKKNIFYPKDVCKKAFDIAESLHPAWYKLSIFSRALMGRNTYQVFGRDLKTPVDFVICWTEDGCESFKDRTIKTGGTGQAIHLASIKGIPVINMRNKNWETKLNELLCQHQRRIK